MDIPDQDANNQLKYCIINVVESLQKKNILRDEIRKR
jgi:hypothetical protein